MRTFLGKLSGLHQTCDIGMYKEYKQLTEKMDAFQVEKLISMFAQIKGTGKIKPGMGVSVGVVIVTLATFTMIITINCLFWGSRACEV